MMAAVEVTADVQAHREAPLFDAEVPAGYRTLALRLPAHVVEGLARDDDLPVHEGYLIVRTLRDAARQALS